MTLKQGPTTRRHYSIHDVKRIIFIFSQQQAPADAPTLRANRHNSAPGKQAGPCYHTAKIWGIISGVHKLVIVVSEGDASGSRKPERLA